MELCIRSQNKMKLSRFIDLRIILEQEGASIIDNTDDYILGMYNSEERALEVLDEIQKLLQPQMLLSKVGKPIGKTCDGTVYVSPNEYEVKELSTYVYEMPEE